MTVRAALFDQDIDPPIEAITESISFVIDLTVPVPEEEKKEEAKVDFVFVPPVKKEKKERV